jgi:hypothetical protein
MSFRDERTSRRRRELDPLSDRYVEPSVGEVANPQLRFGLDSLDDCSSSLFRLHHVHTQHLLHTYYPLHSPFVLKNTPGKR